MDTGTVAIVCAAVAVGGQSIQRFFDARAQRRDKVLQHRREALLAALEVVDHVFSNAGFDDKPPVAPGEWDLSLAHNAMTMMTLYCQDPVTAVRAFKKAIGLRMADEPPAKYGPAQLAEFRQIVFRELGRGKLKLEDQDAFWIATLPGAKFRTAVNAIPLLGSGTSESRKK